MPKPPVLDALEQTLRVTASDPPAYLRRWAFAEWEVAVVFVALYMLLERISYVHPLTAAGITPWHPQVGLVLAFVLARRVRAMPAILIATAASETLMRVTPAPIGLILVSVLITAVGYGCAGLVLARRLSARMSVTRLADFAWVLVVTSVTPLLVGAAYVAANAMFEQLALATFVDALVRYWIGDVVGILAILPLALVLVEASTRARLAVMLKKWETVLQFGCALAILFAVYMSPLGGHIKYFFILFLPLIWAAARHGLIGATAMLVFIQAGLILVVQIGDTTAYALVELQARMIALSVTGLLLGVVVDERERARERLQQSMRLAAAGEMAAALAHEVNQPLSALVTYGRACQLILAQSRVDDPQLSETVGKLAEQAQRVSSIVNRLRDFLRSGTMNLERVCASDFLHAIRASFLAEANAEGIDLKLRVDDDVGSILVDRLELEIVLRNLISNAIDAIRDARPQLREIRILAVKESADTVRLSVIDSGPGVLPVMRDRLFTPFSTSKPQGMGLGLAISRAIAQAHGGKLWAESADYGAFHLILPTNAGERDDHGA